MGRQAGGMEGLALSEGRLGHQAAESDAALVASAQRGDRSAFEQLYLRHRDRMYTLCLNLCGDADEAQDLLQETFVRAYRGLPKFRGASQFITWLYRIALNLCHDAARRRERDLDRVPIETAADPQTTDVSTRAPGESITRVRAALGRLTRRYRIVLALRYGQSLSYQEMAELLQWSLPRVKVTLHRARSAFKEAYLKLGEGQT